MTRINIGTIGGAVLAGTIGCAAVLWAETAAPGKTFRDCSACPEMVVVPAGSFIMGSPPSEPTRDPDEMQHKVTFAKPIAVSVNLVTWDEWDACLRDKACDGPGVDLALRTTEAGAPNPNFVDWGRGNRPVVGINWYDANAYMTWLNAKTQSKGYRLLSESEWEYAARAGSTTAYPWGNVADHDYANYGRSEPPLGGEAKGRDTWVNETSPVGSFPPNAFGIYDMHGNIYQWTQDCYVADYALAPADGSPVLTGDCKARVMRGNSWESAPNTMRSANRVGRYPPERRGRNYIGIRVAKTLE